jgi:hypothetical protein
LESGFIGCELKSRQVHRIKPTPNAKGIFFQHALYNENVILVYDDISLRFIGQAPES